MRVAALIWKSSPTSEPSNLQPLAAPRGHARKGLFAARPDRAGLTGPCLDDDRVGLILVGRFFF